MRFKAGVVMWQMDPKLEAALDRIDAVHRIVVDRDAIVTSARDGKHSERSLHYEGRAIDLRTRDLSSGQQEFLAERLKVELGPNYDVVLEETHIHVELDPK